MGLHSLYLSYIDTAIEKYLLKSSNMEKVSMLELGDQTIHDTKIVEKTGKDYFQNKGYSHFSVDINGLHGSLIRDLREPNQFLDFVDTFEIITNSGTTEHVEPREKQYETFKIIHDCLKIGGISIHLNPDVSESKGAWKYHCQNYYSEEFYNTLASECCYDLVSNQIINGLRCAVLRKRADSAFNIDRQVFLKNLSYVKVPKFVKIKEWVGDKLRKSGLRKHD